MSAATRRTQAERSAAIIERLAQLWPRCFAVYEGRRAPLQIGIDEDVIALCKPAFDKGVLTVAELKRALAYYCGNVGYLNACRPNSYRPAIRLPATQKDEAWGLFDVLFGNIIVLSGRAIGAKG
jgi:sRNA-binding protein